MRAKRSQSPAVTQSLSHSVTGAVVSHPRPATVGLDMPSRERPQFSLPVMGSQLPAKAARRYVCGLQRAVGTSGGAFHMTLPWSPDVGKCTLTFATVARGRGIWFVPRRNARP